MHRIFDNVGYLLLFINLICYCYSYFKFGVSYKIFVWYTILMSVIQAVSYGIMKFGMHNLFMSHFYFVGQFMVLSLFYYHLFENKFQKNVVKIGGAICLTALSVQYFLNPATFFKFNMFEIFLTSFLIIIYGTFHLFNLLNSEIKRFYYFNLGVITYLIGSTIIFLSANMAISLKLGAFFKIFMLNSFLYVIYQLLILIEWRANFYKKTLESRNE